MTRSANPQLALQWRQRIDRFAQSELTVAEFCRLEGYSPASLYQWRRNFAYDESQNSARFVPVDLNPGDFSGHLTGCIEVSLPGGAHVKLPAGVAPADCRNLIAAIVEVTTARSNASIDQVVL
jgi:hypothetical protein